MNVSYSDSLTVVTLSEVYEIYFSETNLSLTKKTKEMNLLCHGIVKFKY